MARSRINRASLGRLEERIKQSRGIMTSYVYGIVDRVENGIPHVIRCWEGSIGNMQLSDKEPTILIAEKLEPAILKHKKYKCFYGGRAGTKSLFGMNMMIAEVASKESSVFCFREHMSSLRQSIFRGICGRIKALSAPGFVPKESKWEIQHTNGGHFAFGGMQNIDDIKSTFDFKYFLFEESAATTQEAIDKIGPTLRGVDGAELWWIWNTGSYTDPMSMEFILPYQDDIDRYGYYEDDHHLIIKLTYRDNPWFCDDMALREELEKDQIKVKRGIMSQARYDYVWEGAFNDNIDNSIITQEWFDACVDAHIKLNIEPKGAVVVTHDPADIGKDAKAVMARQGVVFFDGEELDAENANIAFDMACSWALKRNANKFGWDCDGMGALLRDQASKNFYELPIQSYMFKGSEGVERPDAKFSDAEFYGLKGDVKNKDVCKNQRAQFYIDLAGRCRRTYDAVVNGTYHDPDTLVSFSSGMKILNKLRSELCKLPLKPSNSGLIELYGKKDMQAGITLPNGQKIKLPSQNLGDCCMMSMAAPTIMQQRTIPRPPPEMKRMRRR